MKIHIQTRDNMMCRWCASLRHVARGDMLGMQYMVSLQPPLKCAKNHSVGLEAFDDTTALAGVGTGTFGIAMITETDVDTGMNEL